MYNFTKILSKNIKRIRKEKSLSQMQLSNKADLSLAFINSIENGQKWVSAKSLQKISEALEIKPYELFLTDETEDENLELLAGKHEKMIIDIKDIITKYSKD